MGNLLRVFLPNAVVQSTRKLTFAEAVLYVPSIPSVQ